MRLPRQRDHRIDAMISLAPDSFAGRLGRRRNSIDLLVDRQRHIDMLDPVQIQIHALEGAAVGQA